MQYLQVTAFEDSEVIQFPTADDGTLTVASLAAYYPGAAGLKYRVGGHTRAVKFSNGILHPPENGWGDRIYCCVFPMCTYCTIILCNDFNNCTHTVSDNFDHLADNTKTKADEALGTSEPKTSKVDSELKWVHTDLVVLGLPSKTTDEELRDYFSEFGELQLAQVQPYYSYLLFYNFV